MATYELIATAAFGLESQVAWELKALGHADQMVEHGRVRFRADEVGIARASLWLRVADRLQLVVGEFPARTFDELYDGVRGLPWADLLARDAALPVDGKSVKSMLTSVPAVQGVVKKAIVDALARRHRLTVLPETGARHRVLVALREDLATLTLDLTGDGLHRRGYRDLVGAAPLKETMAAGLVSLARWKGDWPLVDPMCGSGTIAIEAALQALDIAPGLRRTFDAERFRFLPVAAWEAAREEARSRARQDREIRVHASDRDPEAVALTVRHARQAGVASAIRIVRAPLRDLAPAETRGLIVTNPPYAERLGDGPEVESLYRQMGQVVGRLPGWAAHVLCAHESFERHFGRPADRRRKLYNGNLRCQLYQYRAVPAPREDAGVEPDGGTLGGGGPLR
ncbi:MAG: class I SAM-dependent RNA methyltransferase [Candidatus Sericytochromatia bacterium]|nr:class I SAM-dependent RNA methyltransferase [Candidatus Sericytochromatia bacterium]